MAAARTMQEHHEVVIAGGGIGGLILALCLDAQYNHSPSTSTTAAAAAAPETNENKIEIHVYESASEFSPGAGGAIGLYANGLRVLRDLSNQHPLLTSLLDDVRTAGCDYIYRRWMRHDGTEVCVAKEDELLKTVSGRTNSNAADDDTTTNLHSLGIRRWKYQKILYDACVKVGIVVHLGKRLIKITSLDRDGNTTTHDELLLLPMTKLEFIDKSTITCSLLIGADGLNSTCRRYVSNPLTPTIYPEPEEFVPLYTGVTCLMGCANVPFIRGICFPSSATTKCHGCFYPTHVPNEQEGDNDDDEKHEMIFQLYFPSPIERPDQWRTLTPGEAKIEGRELATKLRADGWDEMFLAPLEHDTLTGVLRVGIRNREALATWHVPQPNGPVVGPAVLLGDAAHPPVPYIGQGAMMATEDAGTLALVLKEYCPMLPTTTDTTTTYRLDLSSFNKAMETYEQLRVDRVMKVLGSSVELGKTQQKRADSALYNLWRELSIKTQVWLHGTLPVMRLGAGFDYRAKVTEALAV